MQSVTDNWLRGTHKTGKAPRSDPSQWDGKVNSYQLHHVKPIHDNGGVYDLGNIYIVTPLFHKEGLLEKAYHFGKNKD